MIILGEVIST